MQMFAFGGKHAFVNRLSQPLLPITANTISIYYSIMCVFSQKIFLRLIILCSHCSNKLNINFEKPFAVGFDGRYINFGENVRIDT